MTREEQVAYCLNCKLRSFDPKKGVLCSLTNDYADFEDICDSFKVDPAAKNRNTKHAERQSEKQLLKDTLGLSTFGVRSVSAAGWITTGFGGFIFLFFLLFGSISIWGTFFIIIGLVTVNKGSKQKKTFVDKDALDSDLEL